MAPIYDGHDYYKKMLELQEKLRKSEEERIRLEERFKILVQESRSRHDACINRLRLRYIEFLEEQRVRDERNHKLLGTLDRVDSSLSLMSAKTDRLNVLRKQYEAYLLRVYANRGPPGSITGDSGITSQNEDRCPRRITPAEQIKSIPSEITNKVSKTNESVQNKFYNTPEATSNANYQLANTLRNQTTTWMETDPSITRQNNVQHFPTNRNLTSYIHQNVRAYHDPNNEPSNTPYNHEGNLTSHQQFEKQKGSPTEQMEAIQAAPQFAALEPNANLSQYKSADVYQHQIASPTSHQRFNPSTFAQSLQQLNGRTRSNNAQVDARMNEPPHSLDFRGRSNSTKQISPLPNYLNYTLDGAQNAQGSISDVPRSLTSSDVDDMLRQNERLVSRHLDARGTPHRFSTSLKQAPQVEDDGRTTMILESELDRYIGKIRSLHRELDMQSLEELDHEQNTSGDLLNVTLSDDDVELPVENRSKEAQLPKEVEKILALATDLAARTVNQQDLGRSGKQDNGENRSVEFIEAQRAESPDTERSRGAPPDTHAGQGPSVELAKDEIREDDLLHRPELERHENIEEIVKQDTESSDDTRGSELRSYESPLPGVDEENGGLNYKTLAGKEAVTSFDENDSSKNGQEERLVEDNDKLHAGEEQEVKEHSFDALDKLEPWALDRVEKQVREIDLNDIDKENSMEKDSPVVTKSNVSNVEKDDDGPEKINNAENELESQVKPNETVHMAESLIEKNDYERSTNDTSNSQQQEIEHADQNQLGGGNTQKDTDEIVKSEDDQAEKGKGQEANNLASNEGRNAQQNIVPENAENITNEPYAEETNQMETYAQDPNQEYTDLNQEYAYDQNVPYEGNPEAQYQEYSAEQNQQYGEYTGEQYDQYGNPDGQYQDGTNVQYEQDPNAQYEQDPNLQYEQDPNVQYEQDPNMQYEQDPNAQYEHDPNAQYEQDPNAQYEQDPNAQYEQDPNAQYEQDPNAQYEQDPNAEYATDPNQQYGYNDDQQYDSNQVHKNQPNQSYPYDTNVPYDENQTVKEENEEQGKNEEYEKTEDNSKSQEVVVEKSNEGESKDQEQSQEASQPKKKKDVIKSLLDSDTESTIERNVSNTESDFDFN